MTAALVIGFAVLFAVVGFIVGFVYGANLVVGRIRDYRERVVDPTAPRVVVLSVIGDLLTYLEGPR